MFCSSRRFLRSLGLQIHGDVCETQGTVGEGWEDVSKRRIVATGAASAALALGATIGLAGTASAATSQGVCGSGYTVRDSANLGGARVYLLRDGQKACVVTLKVGSAVGNSVEIGAWIGTASGDSWADVGKFSTYAGPIKVTSPCVNWGGHYGEYSSFYNTPC